LTAKERKGGAMPVAFCTIGVEKNMAVVPRKRKIKEKGACKRKDHGVNWVSQWGWGPVVPKKKLQARAQGPRILLRGSKT